MAKKKQAPGKRPELELVEFYQRNGYMRVPNLALRSGAPRDYKKGYEVRLVARSQRELSTIRRLLKLVELRPGKPFPKHKQWVQPIYGRDAMDLFQSWLETYGNKTDAKPATRTIRPEKSDHSAATVKVALNTSKVKKAGRPTAATGQAAEPRQPKKTARPETAAKPVRNTSKGKNTASSAATAKVARRTAR